ncbi:MAG: hypothetical protein DHS20C16_17810 [Phycisphaerae bacterium]|nr:MAG: hypothetical protein DHS20C16_17810 [Phycisphaerae bacterium]
MFSKPKTSRAQKITLIAFVVVFLFPAAVGFGIKLYEFIAVANGATSEGTFMLVPVLNYFIVFMGMLCMLAWATTNGMFRDIEKPKFDMLRREQELDERDGKPWTY